MKYLRLKVNNGYELWEIEMNGNCKYLIIGKLHNMYNKYYDSKVVAEEEFYKIAS